MAFDLTGKLILELDHGSVSRVINEAKTRLGSDIGIKVKGPAELTTRAITSLTKKLEKLGAAFKAANAETQVYASTLSAAGPKIANVANSINVISVSSRDASRQTKKASSEVKTFGKEADIATSRMLEFGRQTGITARRFSTFIISATAFYQFTRALGTGISRALEFNTEMVRLSQVTGRSITQLRGVQQTIDKFSTQFGVSSKALSEVAVTLGQAGFNARETQYALATLAKTTLAPTFKDITNTTEGLIAAFRQFGLQAHEFDSAFSSINSVAARFAVESEDIVTAIQKAGGAFVALDSDIEGIPLKSGTQKLREFISVFSAIRDTTRESADSIATGLRTITARIQRPATQDFLKDFLGVSISENGKFIGGLEAILRLNRAIADQKISPRDIRFAQITEEIGGIRQSSRTIPLLTQGAKISEAIRVAENEQKSLDKDALKSQEALQKSLDKTAEKFLKLFRDVVASKGFQELFKGLIGISNLLIKIGDSLSGILAPLAAAGFAQIAYGGASSFIKGGVRGFSEFPFDPKATRPNGPALLFNPFKKAAGGFIPGYGGGDKVPALLERGEYVLPKDKVREIGLSKLESFRQKGVRKYAKGGYVGDDLLNSLIFSRAFTPNDKVLLNRARIKNLHKDEITNRFLKYSQLNVLGRNFTLNQRPIYNRQVQTGVPPNLQVEQISSEEVLKELKRAESQRIRGLHRDPNTGKFLKSLQLNILNKNFNQRGFSAVSKFYPKGRVISPNSDIFTPNFLPGGIIGPNGPIVPTKNIPDTKAFKDLIRSIEKLNSLEEKFAGLRRKEIEDKARQLRFGNVTGYRQGSTGLPYQGPPVYGPPIPPGFRTPFLSGTGGLIPVSGARADTSGRFNFSPIGPPPPYIPNEPFGPLPPYGYGPRRPEPTNRGIGTKEVNYAKLKDLAEREAISLRISKKFQGINSQRILEKQLTEGIAGQIRNVNPTISIEKVYAKARAIAERRISGFSRGKSGSGATFGQEGFASGRELDNRFLLNKSNQVVGLGGNFGLVADSYYSSRFYKRTRPFFNRLRGIGNKFSSLGNRFNQSLPGRFLTSYGGALPIGLGLGGALLGQTIGTVDAARNKQERSRGFIGDVTSGTFGGGSAGAFLGAQTGNPYGILIGGALGAIGGFVSSITSAKKKIQEADLGDTLENLNIKLQESVSDFSKTDYGGISQLVKESRARIERGAKNSGFLGIDYFATNASKEAATTEGLKNISGDLGLYSSFLDKQIEQAFNSGVFDLNFNDTNKGSVLQSLRDVGGGTFGRVERLAYDVQRANGVNVGSLDEELSKQIENFISGKKFTQATRRIEYVIDKFFDLSSAVNAAGDSVSNFTEQASTVSAVFGGGVAGQTFRINGVLNRPGGIDTGAYNAEVTRIGGLFGKQGQELAQNLIKINKLERELPGALEDLVNFQGSQDIDIALGDAISKSLGSGTFANLIEDRVVNQFSKGKVQDVLTGSTKEASEQILSVLRPFREILPEAAERLKDEFDNLSKGLVEFESNLIKIGQEQDRVPYLQLDVLRERARQSQSNLTVGQLQNPFLSQQRRLAGPNGLNPEALGEGILTLQRDLQALTQGGQTKDTAQQFANLTRRSAEYQQALRNLTDATNLNAGLQERLSDIEADRSDRLSLARGFYTSGISGQAQTARGLLLARQAILNPEGSKNLSIKFREEILSALQSVGDVQNVFGTGKTGNQLIEQLLQKTVGFANLPQGIQAEKVKIEQQIVSNLELAVKAQQELVNVLSQLNATFEQKILGKFDAFITRMGELLSRIGKGEDVKGELARGSAKGGYIFRPNGTDRVPAMLTAGEFVMKRSAVDRIGVDNLKRMNAGHYARGGRVILPRNYSNEIIEARESAREYAKIQFEKSRKNALLRNVPLNDVEKARYHVIEQSIEARNRAKNRGVPPNESERGVAFVRAELENRLKELRDRENFPNIIATPEIDLPIATPEAEPLKGINYPVAIPKKDGPRGRRGGNYGRFSRFYDQKKGRLTTGLNRYQAGLLKKQEKERIRQQKLAGIGRGAPSGNFGRFRGKAPVSRGPSSRPATPDDFQGRIGDRALAALAARKAQRDDSLDTATQLRKSRQQSIQTAAFNDTFTDNLQGQKNLVTGQGLQDRLKAQRKARYKQALADYQKANRKTIYRSVNSPGTLSGPGGTFNDLLSTKRQRFEASGRNIDAEKTYRGFIYPILQKEKEGRESLKDIPRYQVLENAAINNRKFRSKSDLETLNIIRRGYYTRQINEAKSIIDNSPFRKEIDDATRFRKEKQRAIQASQAHSKVNENVSDGPTIFTDRNVNSQETIQERLKRQRKARFAQAQADYASANRKPIYRSTSRPSTLTGSGGSYEDLLSTRRTELSRTGRNIDAEITNKNFVQPILQKEKEGRESLKDVKSQVLENADINNRKFRAKSDLEFQNIIKQGYKKRQLNEARAIIENSPFNKFKAGDQDKIPSLLSEGEFVLNKKAVNSIGPDKLKKVNRFAQGGLVGQQNSNSGTQSVTAPNFDIINKAAEDINKAILQFAKNAQPLAEALNSFPREISMKGQHSLEVVINGAQALANLTPEFKQMVESEIRNSLQKLLKDKFPEAGGL